MKAKSNGESLNIVNELSSLYFNGESKFTSDKVQRIYNAVERFHNGCMSANALIKELSKHTGDTQENIKPIVMNHFDFEGFDPIVPAGLYAQRVYTSKRGFKTELYNRNGELKATIPDTLTQPRKSKKHIVLNGVAHELRFIKGPIVK